jgi:acyl carrier protein phosphodiesterase
MNFLAHARLSFGQPQLLVGNMISDFVKGKARFDYPQEVQRGIGLHREIDRYTDSHPAVREAKKHFALAYRLYAGAFVDVAFDHFLANDEKEFAHEEQLLEFSRQTYAVLTSYREPLPEKFSGMLPYMVRQNWLFHYRFPDGISRSFRGLVCRAAYLADAAPALAIFSEQHQSLQSLYKEFFPELKTYCLDKMNFPDKHHS